MQATDTVRQTLIAINTGQDLSRDSICKLALALEQWTGSEPPSPAQARRLEVPLADLQEATRLAAGADELARQQLRRATDEGIDIVTLADSSYPGTLRQLALPPPVLYCRGRLSAKPGIGIVGSRQATPQGLAVAEQFGRHLATHGLTVVSGFARGIDQAAHRGALSAPQGETLAVLGCGLDVDYPRGRRRLRRQVADHGALVTEFPLASSPLPRNFPIRNRLIAALSLGVLVVQGTPKSGSLITAKLALDLGRDVYAIPGSILDPRSAGPNALIQDGALLVSRPADILESLPVAIQDRLPTAPAGDPPPSLEGPAGELLRAMTPGRTVTADQLARETDSPLDGVLGRLLELEMAGLVNRSPGPLFSRKL